jgi:hypothetical protein
VVPDIVEIVGWKQFVRAVQADARRHQREVKRQNAREERESMRRHRELHRLQRELDKQSEKARAANDVARFDNYLELLVSLHCDDDMFEWDWADFASALPPNPPMRRNDYESAATGAQILYVPNLIDRLFGAAKRRQAELQAGVEKARREDDAQYARAMQEHHERERGWAARRALASRILSSDSTAYLAGLEHASAFAELASFQTRVTVAEVEREALAVTCEITDDEIVPTEEVKLTASGKLTKKSMATSKYWALYQDHLCSAALRVARETFDLLPIVRTVVNIGPVRVNTATGHRESVVFLAAHFSRSGVDALNLAKIDPSDSMKNFPHRMKFKKTTGFDPVEPMLLSEQWITT